MPVLQKNLVLRLLATFFIFFSAWKINQAFQILDFPYSSISLSVFLGLSYFLLSQRYEISFHIFFIIVGAIISYKVYDLKAPLVKNSFTEDQIQTKLQVAQIYAKIESTLDSQMDPTGSYKKIQNLINFGDQKLMLCVNKGCKELFYLIPKK